ncbi:MAG: FGGY family carbohydrate kinase, partial [Ilumatobacteraceae bacterium]
MSGLLVVDVGTTGLRAAVLDGDATIRHLRYRAFPPSTPFPGLVEVDAVGLAGEVLAAVHEVLDQHGGPVDAVGITDQRATTIVW